MEDIEDIEDTEDTEDIDRLDIGDTHVLNLRGSASGSLMNFGCALSHSSLFPYIAAARVESVSWRL